MNRTLRSAFTLLEVMIALALLGALMAVAWSLLGTFRNAEIRGWRLAHRTQLVRSARDWLENDLQHLAISEEASSPANPLRSQSATSGSALIGNAMGFTATVAPSLDPIPFLENLMSDSRQSEPRPSTPSASLRDLNDAMDAESSATPWPAETVDIEYILTRKGEGSLPSSVLPDAKSEDIQYVLTRREMIAPKSSTAANPSEKVLTTQDLYRQAEDPMLSARSSSHESKLEGLTKAQFKYHDGTGWKSAWNSQQQGGMPRAVALGFDFPANSDIQPPSRAVRKRDDPEQQLEGTLGRNTTNTLDTLPIDEPLLESNAASDESLMESSTNEIQIIVWVGKGFKKKVTTSPMSAERVRP